MAQDSDESTALAAAGSQQSVNVAGSSLNLIRPRRERDPMPALSLSDSSFHRPAAWPRSVSHLSDPPYSPGSTSSFASASREQDAVAGPSRKPESTSSNEDTYSAFNSTPRCATLRKEDDWKFWVAKPTTSPPAKVPADFKPVYTSIDTVRHERKVVTKRALRRIGRIPLKEYLEVGDDYLAVRRTGRKCVTAWLQPFTRIARQDPQRIKACIHRLEHDHPILAMCEDHWKAKQIIMQTIDNAFDEQTLQRRKSEKRARSCPESSAHGAATAESQSQDDAADELETSN